MWRPEAYCLDEPNVYLQGTRNSEIELEEYSYVVFEVSNCNNDTRGENDPECATPEEINEWISTKQIQIRIVDNKIDFDSYSKNAVR